MMNCPNCFKPLDTSLTSCDRCGWRMLDPMPRQDLTMPSPIDFIARAEHERLMAEARNKALDEAAKIAIFHLERLPNYNRHTENDLADKVEEGYGNACINIAAAIRAMKRK